MQQLNVSVEVNYHQTINKTFKKQIKNMMYNTSYFMFLGIPQVQFFTMKCKKY